MKIEKLIIQNLNSIEYAEINFSVGILANEPLFLICGETGSGKSTILDAITLALYDKASRYESVKNKERTEDGKNNTKDTANILRKGKNDGKAELYFSVNDDHYIATWSMHKTRNNSYNTNDRRCLEIIDGERRTVISSNVVAVNKKIEELVGLTYEQFVRSVMLAQGEFNTFLKSKKSEQSEILEMLTGTEVYSKIAETIKQRKSAAQKKKDELESLYNKLNDNSLLSEQIEEIENECAQIEEDLLSLGKELKLYETQIEWLKKNDSLRIEIDNARTIYENVLSKVDSQEYKDNKNIVEDYFKTAKERESLKELFRLESELITLRQAIDNDCSSFLNINNSLQEWKIKKDEMINLQGKLKQWLDNHKDYKAICDNLNYITDLLNSLSDISSLLMDKVNELRDNEDKKKIISAELESLSQSFENVKKSKNEAEQNLEILLNDFDSDAYKKLLEKHQILDGKRKEYVDRKSKLINVRTILEQYLELSQNIKNEQDNLAKLKSLSKEKNIVYNQFKAAFESKDLEYQTQKDMVENWAKEYRSRLKDNEPCPVCGSRTHLYKDEEIVKSLFSSIKSEWENLKHSYETARDELNKIETELNLMLRNISSEENRLAILHNNLNIICNGNIIYDIERINLNINKYNNLIEDTDKEILNVNEELKNIANVKKRIDEAKNVKKLIDDRYNSNEKTLRDKQDEYQHIELLLNTIRTVIKEQESKYQEKEKIVGEYIRIENWKQSFLSSSDDFIQTLVEIAAEWNRNNTSYQNIENQLIAIDDVMGQANKYTHEIMNIITDDNLEYEKKDIELQELIPELLVVNEKINSKMSEKNKMESAIDIIKKAIDEYLSVNKNIDFNRLKYLSEISDIQHYVKMNKDIDEELVRSRNTMSIKKDEFDSHQKEMSKPESEVTIDELETKLINVKKDKAAKEETLSKNKITLEINKKRSLEIDSCEKELLEEDKKFKLWEQLAKVIGTTDNNNFRDVAQAYTMSILLDRANFYMQQLSNRYLLTNYSDSLAIMVQDKELGNELRTASSLSGGETFLVSLALALGLTSISDNNFNVDLIFIDEGFGTLDTDSLDMVMNTLENLHSLGRRVGIISHVDALKERIPAKIQLVREGKSTSRVEVLRN